MSDQDPQDGEVARRRRDGGNSPQTIRPAEIHLHHRFAAVPLPVPERILILLARFWQIGPSRLLPPTCRYTPSCSAYAIEAWTRYGAVAGTWLALKRIVRCNPWGGCGHDPVP